MTELTMKQRCERLDRFITEGRIIRNAWTDKDGVGGELACLYAALVPEAGNKQSASACPADVMPQWLAYLTPGMDDYLSDKMWLPFVKRYAALAHRWHVLNAAAWRRCDMAARIAALEQARSHDKANVVEPVIQLCKRVLDGDEPTEDEWSAAAYAAAYADAAYADAAAAADAARASADVAASAAYAADAAAWAIATATARASVWDRVASKTLDAIDRECLNSEASARDEQNLSDLTDIKRLKGRSAG